MEKVIKKASKWRYKAQNLEGDRTSRKLFKIVLVIFLAVVIFSAAGLSLGFFDGAASAATRTQSLTPTSYPVGPAPGNALVVYDPGSTGAVKGIADEIASDLQAQGYFVYLAGIDSTTAKANPSQYKVIAVGGPIVDGKVSSSVQSFLNKVTSANGTEIGVFGVSNSNTPNSPNNQIVTPPSGSSLIIKEQLQINTSQDTTTESAEFVKQLLS